MANYKINNRLLIRTTKNINTCLTLTVTMWHFEKQRGRGGDSSGRGSLLLSGVRLSLTSWTARVPRRAPSWGNSPGTCCQDEYWVLILWRRIMGDSLGSWCYYTYVRFLVWRVWRYGNWWGKRYWDTRIVVGNRSRVTYSTSLGLGLRYCNVHLGIVLLGSLGVLMLGLIFTF